MQDCSRVSQRFAASWNLLTLWPVILVHKDRQLDFVGWYTLLPSSGPSSTILAIHNQILEAWNESAVLLGFHPEEVLNHSVGGKLPLTIYESNYEVDDPKADQDGEDKKMDDGEPSLKLKFRELPYSVETDETEMISMNYVAGAGGSAAAATSKEEKPARSVESNGKGKRRLIESEEERKQAAQDDDLALTPEEDEMIAALNAKSNAIKMLHSRIRLLTTYLERLPPSYVNGESAESEGMETDNTSPSLTVLRQIQALVSRLDLVIPSDEASFEKEILHEANDVNLVELLNGIMQSVTQTRDVGKKFHAVESGKPSNRSRTDMFLDAMKNRGDPSGGPGGYPHSAAGDIFI